jgi:hypothetical protein
LLPHPVRKKADDIPEVIDIPYEELPKAVKQNLTPGQRAEARMIRSSVPRPLTMADRQSD